MQVIYTASGDITPIPYTEGLLVDYRHFDAVLIQSCLNVVTDAHLKITRKTLVHASSSDLALVILHLIILI